jgi:AraC-like DNA-binding protein
MSGVIEDRNRRMLRARDAMDRAFAQPLDVAALARVAHVSTAHFSRQFRDTFGETPHRYLQRRCVERAMELLRETERSVTEICFDVGWGSLGTFQPDVQGDRGRVAVGLPGAVRGRRGPAAGSRLLGDGVDAPGGVSAPRVVEKSTYAVGFSTSPLDSSFGEAGTPSRG